MKTLEEYLSLKKQQFDDKKKEENELYEKNLEYALNEELSKEEREKYINSIIYLTLDSSKEGHDFDRGKFITIYKECEQIWKMMKSMFECEWLDDDSLIVDINCKTLSHFCIIISKLCDLHAGMFGFSSSFTTHEAYTKLGHKINLTTTEDGKGVIKFLLK